MITAHPERGRPCRPADLFRATKAAENLFGAGASRLSIELLEHIEEEDSELVDRIFERRRRAHVDASRVELSGLAVDERVRHLTELLDSQGFLADCEMLGPELDVWRETGYREFMDYTTKQMARVDFGFMEDAAIVDAGGDPDVRVPTLICLLYTSPSPRDS